MWGISFNCRIRLTFQAACIVNSVAVTTCAASDFVCLCTNSAFINKAINCINTGCDASDAANAYAYATFACQSVGVTVPSVDSVLHPSGSSSAADLPATSSAAAPVASSSAPAAASTSAAAVTSSAPSSTKTASAASSSGNKTHTSAVVTFEGSAPNVAGIHGGLVAVVAMGVVAVLGVGLL